VLAEINGSMVCLHYALDTYKTILPANVSKITVLLRAKGVKAVERKVSIDLQVLNVVGFVSVDSPNFREKIYSLVEKK